MPYDPALPADHSPLVSAEMRAQLNGLNDLIATIPAGPQGPQGVPGVDGMPGAPGPPGMDGEVSSSALSSAISGTSSNSNAVATLDTPFANDPATLADMEVMRAAHNALVLALRR